MAEQLDTTLVCKRLWFTDKSTTSELFIGNEFQCNVLEDAVRDKKIAGKTAIPFGKYEVVLSWSSRFGMVLPLLMNVPGFDGVRVHWGNKPEDTEGCPLVGTVETNTKDWISSSKRAFSILMPRIRTFVELGKVYWEVIDGREAIR